MNQLAIISVWRQHRLEAANETIRPNEEASGGVVRWHALFDESLEGLLCVEAILSIERAPDIRERQEGHPIVEPHRMRVAAPWPVRRMCHLSSSNRIHHNVAENPQEARPTFNYLALVPPLKDVADSPVSSVEPPAVRAIEVLHHPRQWMVVRLHQEVHMIRHQTERDDFDAKPLRRPLEHAEIPRVIHIVDEHLTLVIAARHHVMKHPWDVQSERSRHALREEQLLGRVANRQNPPSTAPSVPGVGRNREVDRRRLLQLSPRRCRWRLPEQRRPTGQRVQSETPAGSDLDIRSRRRAGCSSATDRGLGNRDLTPRFDLDNPTIRS